MIHGITLCFIVFSFCTLQYARLSAHPIQFVEEYLKRCTLPSSVKISDYPWNEFISEVVKRIPGAHEHCYLVDLIFVRIAKVYEADNRAKSFVLDLFELTEPRLLAGTCKIARYGTLLQNIYILSISTSMS